MSPPDCSRSAPVPAAAQEAGSAAGAAQGISVSSSPPEASEHQVNDY